MIRVLVAKPGLDGHDRGAKIVATALRNAGMEVIYGGLHESLDEIVNAALQEDVDVIGLSILSGAHKTILRKLVAQLKKAGLQDVMVIVGGIIPAADIPYLKRLGVAAVFNPGTPLREVIAFIEKSFPNKNKKASPSASVGLKG
jgi:methylmalonyl-CoA mutase C-terminal domain/subunit